MAPRVRAPALRGRQWLNVPAPWPVPFDVSLLAGKVVLLDFWTFCCINCLRVLDELRALEERFAEELVVIGVHSPKFPHEADPDALAAAIARHRITHPVLDDPERETWSQYAVRAWPTLVLIDPLGYVVGGAAGEGHGGVLAEHIEALVDVHGEELTRDRLRPLPVEPPRHLLAFPGKVAASADGTRVAVADTGHDRVLVCRHDGAVERVVGGLRQPQGVRFVGDRLVVCDTGADRVVDDTGAVLAEGLRSPWDVVEDVDGSLVVAEAGRHRLWRVDGHGAHLLAGTGGEQLVDGPARDALLAQPSGLTRVDDGIAFVDAEASALRLLRDGVVRTVVGTGLFDWDELQHPLGVAASDGRLFVADTFNSRICAWDGRSLTVISDRDLDEPGGIDVLPDGRLLVADTNNHRVVLVDPLTGAVEPFVIRLPTSDRGTLDGEPVVRRRPLPVPYAADLGGEALDASGGAPVRVLVTTAGGTFAWTTDEPVGVVDVDAEVGDEVLVAVDVATCTETTCTIRSVRRRHPVVDA